MPANIQQLPQRPKEPQDIEQPDADRIQHGVNNDEDGLYLL
jgi:hypothetical protein